LRRHDDPARVAVASHVDQQRVREIVVERRGGLADASRAEEGLAGLTIESARRYRE